MKSFFGRLKSEIKKSGWAFGVLYFLIIPYIFLISVAEKRVVFESIIILLAIIILDFLNRIVRKKSEKLFQNINILKKIRNFYDKNPWRKGFFYPAIFFISSYFALEISVRLGDTSPFDTIIGIYLVLAWIGSPLWVIVGYITASKKKPFSVSLLTGFILFPAIVAYIAYEGMENAGRIAATKTIHYQTNKYISAEIQRCKLGESSFMKDTLSCSNINSKNIIQATIDTTADKNPYQHQKLAVRSLNNYTNDEDVGFINLISESGGSDIMIISCNKTPCNKIANRLESIVSIK